MVKPSPQRYHATLALPRDFKDRWRLGIDEDPPLPVGQADQDHPRSALPFQALGWPELREHFRNGPLSSGLILAEDRLAELHAAMHASERKRFVLLAGLSGTGKTLLARAYADAYCRARGLDHSKHYHQVAVRPDWTDPTGLLGFINALTDPPSYQSTGTVALLTQCGEHPDQPFFLCLDEMNLARVEHYFAPFLSAMEVEGGWLKLHGELESVDNVDPKIPWPRNLFIFGTVNMDESTHAFSDKVLDRVFTFEFWDVDLIAWEERKRQKGAPPEMVGRIASVLRRAYAALWPARRHFGYRTADEAFAFCEAGTGALDLTHLLDAAVLTKVLPRIRGDDAGPLESALKDLAVLAGDENLFRTAEKVKTMLAILQTQGQTRFWS
jgi:5-methylcytosine-specific restriction enzyme B